LSYPVVFLQAHLSFLGGELWDTLCGDGPEMIYYDDDDDYYDDDDRICRTQNWDLWVCFVIALLAFGVCEQEMDLLISWAITVSQHSSALWRCCTMNRHCFRTVHKSFVHWPEVRLVGSYTMAGFRVVLAEGLHGGYEVHT
jgi:hypothetical protein